MNKMKYSAVNNFPKLVLFVVKTEPDKIKDIKILHFA